MVTKMRPKGKSKRDMTKAELIDAITAKTHKIPARFQPSVKRNFLDGLKYRDKSRLQRILSRMRIEVDRDGYDIYTP